MGDGCRWTSRLIFQGVSTLQTKIHVPWKIAIPETNSKFTPAKLGLICYTLEV